MKIQRLIGAVFVVLVALLIISNGSVAHAQASSQQAEPVDETNLDTQLYLILATNQVVPDEKLPSSLDGVLKQLRNNLPFKNYRLAATMLHRVKNEGRVELSWIGGPMAGAGTSATLTPSFNQFKVRQVKLAKNSSGETVVQMVGFNFGARVPIQVGQVAANAAGGVVPAINYENTGLFTDISIREGEPVVVGTLNVGPSGDAIILVVAAKRTGR
jgi:hypothetical protein